MNTQLYSLRAMTNMHPGSGDTNYGIIDKEVQRDAISKFPVIHASSLKGAFRELFSRPESSTAQDVINRIFGDEKSDKSVSAHHIGSHRFHEAQLLGLPVRSNFAPFFMATCPFLLKSFISTVELFRIDTTVLGEDFTALKELSATAVQAGHPKVYTHIDLPPQGGHIDEYEIKNDNIKNALGKLQQLLGNDLVLFSDNDFKDLCKRLPIIARNQLNNGISNNLWYEEIIPRQSVFYFVVETDGNDFMKTMKTHKNLVQIGGNATVGYGLSKIELLNLEKVPA